MWSGFMRFLPAAGVRCARWPTWSRSPTSRAWSAGGTSRSGQVRRTGRRRSAGPRGPAHPVGPPGPAGLGAADRRDLRTLAGSVRRRGGGPAHQCAARRRRPARATRGRRCPAGLRRAPSRAGPRAAGRLGGAPGGQRRGSGHPDGPGADGLSAPSSSPSPPCRSPVSANVLRVLSAGGVALRGRGHTARAGSHCAGGVALRDVPRRAGPGSRRRRPACPQAGWSGTVMR